MSQPLTLRYNNPGAVEFKPWMGAYGATLGPNGRYAQFETPDQGYSVMGRILDTYQNKHGLNTVSGIVNRWAPADVDNNSTGSYINSVSRRLGIDPNAPLTQEQRTPLMQAMAAYEAGRAPAPMGGAAPPASSTPPASPGAAPMNPMGAAPSANGWTPESVGSSRQLGARLLNAGMDTGPAQHWTQALARVLQAGSGAAWTQQANEGERAGNQAVADIYRQGLQGNVPVKQLAAQLMDPARGGGFGMEDGKNIARAVIAQEVKGPEQTEAQRNFAYGQRNPDFARREIELKQAGRPQTTVEMKQEGAESQAIGKASAEAQVEAFKAAGSAQQQLQQLAGLQARLERLKTGASAPAVRTAAAWAKDLGVSPDVLKQFGITDNFVGDAQAFEAATAGMLVNKLGSGGFPSNNFSNADREFLEKTLPRLSNDPRANRIMVEAARRVEQSKIDKARSFQEWRKAPENKSKSFFDFDIDYAQKVGNRFDDLVQEARGMMDSAGQGFMPQPTAPGQAAPQQNGGGGQVIQGARQMIPPPAAAIERLRANPAEAALFDQVFGQGASSAILGQGQPQQPMTPEQPAPVQPRRNTMPREVFRNG